MTRFVFLIRSTISPRLFVAADTVWSFHFPAARITVPGERDVRLRLAWAWGAWHGNGGGRHSPSGIATNSSSPLASAARDLAWLKSKSRSSCDDRAEPAWSPLSLWPCPPPPPLLLRRPLSVAAPRSAVTCPAKQVTYGNS